jgi:hypothetical protein
MSGQSCCEFSEDNMKNESETFDMYSLIKSQKPHWNELIKHNKFNSSTYTSTSIFGESYENLFNPELYLNKMKYWMAFGKENKQDPIVIFTTVCKLTKEYLEKCELTENYMKYSGVDTNSNNYEKNLELFCKNIFYFLKGNVSYDIGFKYIVMLCFKLEGDKNKVKNIFNEFFQNTKEISSLKVGNFRYETDILMRMKLKYLEQYNSMF